MKVGRVARIVGDAVRGALPGIGAAPVPSTARWSPERAATWHEARGWLAGCNFIPSSACNPLEMWQAAGYDADTIDRELGWAASLGFTSVRVFLHDLVWMQERDRFLDRVDAFLAAADHHGIGAMLVLFDGVWDPRPRLGPQAEPRPGVHNSRWVQSPGAEAIADRSRWPALRDYLQATVGAFAHDGRVHAWDLFNEPDNPNIGSYPATELADKRAAVTPLVDACFDWATEVDPDQPLTCGLWTGVHGAVERISELNRVMLARSDVISFHSYRPRAPLVRAIGHLARYGRSLLCTEWLARTKGSTVDLIEDFRRLDVGAYHWGLVEGRTQTTFPWGTWLRPHRDPGNARRRWFHDLLRSDGTPYDESETALIRRVCKGG